MIKSSELRIGNRTCAGKITSFYVSGVSVGFGVSFKFSELESIPITEEILLKCGFKKVRNVGTSDTDKNAYYYQGVIDLTIDFCLSCSDRNYDSLYFNEIKIESFHQLQNLVFALTGEELDIKLKN
jgi:hypothetical protein